VIWPNIQSVDGAASDTARTNWPALNCLPDWVVKVFDATEIARLVVDVPFSFAAESAALVSLVAAFVADVLALVALVEAFDALVLALDALVEAALALVEAALADVEAALALVAASDALVAAAAALVPTAATSTISTHFTAAKSVAQVPDV